MKTLIFTGSRRHQKLNIRPGILGNHIIGPIFIIKNWTGKVYRDLLQDEIKLIVIKITQKDESIIGQEVVFH